MSVALEISPRELLYLMDGLVLIFTLAMMIVFLGSATIFVCWIACLWNKREKHWWGKSKLDMNKITSCCKFIQLSQKLHVFTFDYIMYILMNCLSIYYQILQCLVNYASSVLMKFQALAFSKNFYLWFWSYLLSFFPFIPVLNFSTSIIPVSVLH